MNHREPGSEVGGQLKAASHCVLLAQCFASHAGAQRSPTSHRGYTHPELSEMGRERKEGWEKGCQEEYKTLQHEKGWKTCKILQLCRASKQLQLSPLNMLNVMTRGRKGRFAEKSTRHRCINANGTEEIVQDLLFLWFYLNKKNRFFYDYNLLANNITSRAKEGWSDETETWKAVWLWLSDLKVSIQKVLFVLFFFWVGSLLHSGLLVKFMHFYYTLVVILTSKSLLHLNNNDTYINKQLLSRLPRGQDAVSLRFLK